MSEPAPIWPAQLNHLALRSPQPAVLAEFYAEAMAMTVETQGRGRWLLRGRGRLLEIIAGEAPGLAHGGIAVGSDAQLLALRDHIARNGGTCAPAGSTLLQQGAFAVPDPDGNRLLFGVAAGPDDGPEDGPEDGIEGRLQHVVVATADLPAMMAWYERVMGFLPSDYVRDDDGAISAAFYRSDLEHHSFAVFRAEAARLDHHAYETPSWNHIRDWADHFADMRVPIWWGPGRHGPGNNLFFMVQDPDGNKLEFSAELEHVPADVAVREWPHEQRTLNLWGTAWMRS